MTNHCHLIVQQTPLATDVEPLVKFVADLIRVERTLTAGAAALQLPAAAEDDV